MRSQLSWAVALAGIAVASAVVAQTVEGIDMGALKAKAQAEAGDAETLVDAVAKRGEVFEQDAEELRVNGLSAVAQLDPKDLPKGPEGPVDFDEILAGASANTKTPFGDGPLFVAFASLSMPEDALRALIRDTTKAGGVVAFRGFPGNNTKAFVEGLKKVVTSEDQEAHLAVDPRLFRAFNVRAVPTFVAVSREYELCDGFDCSSALPDHDKMIGNVTVEYVLESFAGGSGAGAGVASVALRNLNKGR